MSGEIDITPGITWSSQPVNNANLNATANPTARVRAASIGSRELGIDINTGGGFSSKLVNGNFDIWQRGYGTTNCPAATRTFLADRWTVSPGGATITQERSTTVPDFRSRYSLLLTGAASSGDVDIAQRIESHVVNAGLKTTVVFSAYVYNGTGAAFTPVLVVRTPSAADVWTVNTTRLTENLQSCADAAWTQVSKSFDASALTDVANGLEVVLQIPSGALVGGDTINVAQVDLRVGDTVGVFETLPPSIVLCQCKYYFEELISDGGNGVYVGLASTRNGPSADMSLQWSRKRIAPTVSISDAGHFAILDTSGVNQSVSTFIFTPTSFMFGRVSFTSAGLPAAGGACVFKSVSASARIKVDAEL